MFYIAGYHIQIGLNVLHHISFITLYSGIITIKYAEIHTQSLTYAINYTVVRNLESMESMKIPRNFVDHENVSGKCQGNSN